MDNKDIPGLENYGGGHYVYVKKKYPDGKSKVHTISAIEHWKKDTFPLKKDKIRNRNK